jgi:transcriptional regulator with XRE-family HTH domain
MPINVYHSTDTMLQCPLRLARLALGLTQRDLAEQIGITELSVLLTEQGTYETPPVGLIGTLSDLGKRAQWDSDSLATISLSNYTAWRRLRREYNGSITSKLSDQDITFEDWFERACGGSVSRFSKIILVPLRTAQDFCSGKKSSVIKKALVETFGTEMGTAIYRLERGVI